MERVRRVKQGILAAATGDTGTGGSMQGGGAEAECRQALIHAYRKSKLAILDSILG